MIDFACKQFNLNDVIKCGLGLTRTEFKIMGYFLANKERECDTSSISKKLSLNLTTIQKAVKKLSEKNVILRRQKNLDGGGYIFVYQINSKNNIRKIIKGIIRTWSDKVEEMVDKW